jgi:hypothetical protein
MCMYTPLGFIQLGGEHNARPITFRISIKSNTPYAITLINEIHITLKGVMTCFLEVDCREKCYPFIYLFIYPSFQVLRLFSVEWEDD